MTSTYKRGMATAEAVKARCIIESGTRCWLWQGATADDGTPRLWAFDHARGDKRSMSGPLAMWNIAHGEAPPHWALVFRGCQHRLCLNPAHLRLARDKADIGLHIRRAGTRKGTAIESRRLNIKRAHAANGITPTPAPIVEAIRHADPSLSNVEIAAHFGIAHQTVSRIRRGESRKEAA